MLTSLYTDKFAHQFEKLLQKTGVSCYQIHEYTGLDQGYLSRLRNGKKANPSVETIVKICLAIANYGENIQLFEFESLLNSVGRSLQIKS